LKRKRKAIIVSYQPLTTPVKAKGYEKRKLRNLPYALVCEWLVPKNWTQSDTNITLFGSWTVFLSLLIGIKRSKEIGVIHSHGFAAGLVGAILGGILRKRKVISTHAIYNFENRPFLAFLIRNILRHYDYVLAVGEPSKTRTHKK